MTRVGGRSLATFPTSVIGGKLFRKPQQQEAAVGTLDAGKRLHHADRFAAGKRGRADLKMFGAARFRNSVEKCRNRNFGERRTPERASGADAVPALFVFLYLLECQPEELPEVTLRHAFAQPQSAQVVVGLHANGCPPQGAGWTAETLP